jgi:hypothetical protein
MNRNVGLVGGKPAITQIKELTTQSVALSIIAFKTEQSSINTGH